MSIHDLIPRIDAVPLASGELRPHHLPTLTHADWGKLGPLLYAAPKVGHTWKERDEELFALGHPLARWTRGWQYLLHRLWFVQYGVIAGLGDDLGPHEGAVGYDLASIAFSPSLGLWQVEVRRAYGDADPFDLDGAGLILPPGGELTFSEPSWLAPRRRFHVVAIPLAGSVGVGSTFALYVDADPSPAAEAFGGEGTIRVVYRFWRDRGVEPWRRIDDIEPDYFAPATIEILPEGGVFGDVVLAPAIIRYWKSWDGEAWQHDQRYFRALRHRPSGEVEDVSLAVAARLEVRDTPTPVTYAKLASLGWTSADTVKVECRVWVESESEGSFTGLLRRGRCRHSAKDYSGSFEQDGGRYCDEPAASQRSAFRADCAKAGWCSHYEPARPQHPLDAIAMRQILVQQPWVAEYENAGDPTYAVRRALSGRTPGVEGGCPSIAAICDIDLEAVRGWEPPVQHLYKGGWQGLRASDGMPARGHERDLVTGDLGPFAWPDKPPYLDGGSLTEAQAQGALARALDVDADGNASGSIGNYVRCGYEPTQEDFVAGEADAQTFGDGHVFERGAWDASFAPCAPSEAVYRWRMRFRDNARVVGYATVRAQSYSAGRLRLELATGQESCRTLVGAGEEFASVFRAGGNIVRPADPWRINNAHASGRKRGSDSDGGAVPGHRVHWGAFDWWISGAWPYRGAIQPVIYGGAEYDEDPTAWNAQWDDAVGPHATSLPPPRDWGYGRGTESAREYLHRGDVIELIDEHGLAAAAGVDLVGQTIELRNGGVAYPSDSAHRPRVWVDGVEVAASEIAIWGAKGWLFGTGTIAAGAQVRVEVYLALQKIAPVGLRPRYSMPATAEELNHLTESLDNLWLICSREAVEDARGIRTRPADRYEMLNGTGGEWSGPYTYSTDWNDYIDNYTGPFDGADLYSGKSFFGVDFNVSFGEPLTGLRSSRAHFNIASGPWRIPELDACPWGAEAVSEAFADISIGEATVNELTLETWIDTDPEGALVPMTDPEGYYYHARSENTPVENPELALFLAGYDREDSEHAELRLLSPVGSVIAGPQYRIDMTAFVKAYLQNRARCRAFEMLAYPVIEGVSFDFTGSETREEALRKIIDKLSWFASGPTFVGYYLALTLFAMERHAYQCIWSPPTIHRLLVRFDWGEINISGGLQYGPINSNGIVGD